MSKVDFLVIESDAMRAQSVAAALHFLGYHPQSAAEYALAAPASTLWRGVYVGTLGDVAEAERQFALLGEAANQVPVLLAVDSPWTDRLLASSSPCATHAAALEFPLAYEALADTLHTLQMRLAGAHRGEFRFVGESAPMRHLNALIHQVAPLDSSVLVLGESGTGKEMVARAIHEQSVRRD